MAALPQKLIGRMEELDSKVGELVGNRHASRSIRFLGGHICTLYMRSLFIYFLPFQPEF